MPVDISATPYCPFKMKTITFRLFAITVISIALCTAGCRRAKTEPVVLKDRETETDEIRKMIDEGIYVRESGDPYHASFVHLDALLRAEAVADTSLMIQINCQLGRDARYMGQTDEAINWYSDALELSESAYSGEEQDRHETFRLDVLSDLGALMMVIDMDENAMVLLSEALDAGRVAGDDWVTAENAFNMGYLHEKNGRTGEAERYYQAAIKHAAKSGNQAVTGRCHNRFGYMALAEGDWMKAEREFLSSYDLLDDNGLIYKTDPCLGLARLYLRQGRYEKAYIYITRAEALAVESHTTRHLSNCNALYSEYFEKTGDPQKALDHYRLSIEQRDSVLNNSQKLDAEQLKNKYQQIAYDESLSIVQNQRYRQTRKAMAALLIVVAVSAIAILIIGLMVYSLKEKTRANEAMQRVEDARKAFFTNITHELRTPLTILLGMARSLKKKVEGKPSQEEELDAIIDQGDYLLDMVNKLLDIAKVQSSIEEPKWRTGDVSLLLQSEMDAMSKYAGQNLINLEYSSLPGSLVMDFVPSYLTKSFGNLLSNAIRFTGRGGHVRARLSLDGETVLISVTDDGQGISAEDLPHIFDMFYQGSSPGRGNGSGVGLAMTREMVSAMEGKVSVSSREGEGTCFTIALPRYHGESGYPIWVPKTKTAETESSRHIQEKKTATVLLVEDNPEVARYEGSVLGESYNVLYARNGQEGLDMAKEYIPEIIVTDLMMPVSDGNDFCRKVRASIEINHIPIVVVSAKSTEDDRIDALKCGANYFISKPFNPDELSSVIANALKTKDSEKESIARAMHEGKEEILENASDKNKEFLSNLNSAIFTKMSDPEFSAESLAGMLCLSHRQLSRKVKALTGFDTTTYIRKARMSSARKLLISSNLPIGEIVGQCGFYSSSYFTKLYRQEYGETPSGTRKSLKKMT